MTSVKILQVLRLNVFHEQVQLSVDLSMLMVTNDSRMIADFCQQFAPTLESSAGAEVKA